MSTNSNKAALTAAMMLALGGSNDGLRMKKKSVYEILGYTTSTNSRPSKPTPVDEESKKWKGKKTSKSRKLRKKQKSKSK